MENFWFNKTLSGTISIGGSKSITNRLYIIRALCGKDFKIHNESTSDDSKILLNILSNYRPSEKQVQRFNVEGAGTAMRFLTAFFAAQPDIKIILGGNHRMNERPIAGLVNALISLGSSISYLENNGYPPLYIEGKALSARSITVESGISSQFISALMLIAPYLKNELTIEFSTPPVSFDYIRMTAEIMRFFGCGVTINNRSIIVTNNPYVPKDFFVESDWSSASYWYLACLAAPSASLTLQHFFASSYQGDAVVSEIFDRLGVKTHYEKDSIKLVKEPISSENLHFTFNFSGCPDLVQTIAVAVSILKGRAVFSGLSTLLYKETNRIEALQKELSKLNVKITYENNIMTIDATDFAIPENTLLINTYNDHRMAMAFAPLGFIKKDLIIENSEVVNKSYPEFWIHLKSVCHD